MAGIGTAPIATNPYAPPRLDAPVAPAPARSCSKCSAPAVTFVRYSGQHLCGDHFLHFFEKRAKLEVARRGRLPHGTIAVALSGGKDSVACLHFLEKVSRDNPKVDLVAVSVDEGIAGYRQGALDICRRVTEERGVPWHTVAIRDLAGYDIDDYAAGGGKHPTGEDRPACGPCGVFRRTGINTLARELGASAVATGHNLDDTAQTVLMNVLNGDLDRLARLAPHDAPRPGLVPRLLPFRSIPEKEVLLYGLLEGLPIHDEAECPYAARANRFRMRDVLLGLEADQPGTRHGLLRFHDRVREAVPPEAGGEVSACAACGEPTSGETCKTCAWRA